MLIDFDGAMVDLDAGFLGFERRHVRRTAGSQQYLIGRKNFRLSAYVAFDSLIVPDALHFGIGEDVDSRRVSDLQQRVADVIVEPRRDFRSGLKYRDLATRAREREAELQSDEAAADDDEVFRLLLQMDQLVARDAALGAGDRRPRRLRAGGGNEFVPCEFFTADDYFLRSGELGLAADRRDALFLEPALFSFRPARDETVLARDRRGPVEGNVLGPFEAEPAGAARLPVKLDGAHEHLFRDSAAREAGSGEALFFDDSDARAELHRRFRGVRACGAAADDDQIVIHQRS